MSKLRRRRLWTTLVLGWAVIGAACGAGDSVGPSQRTGPPYLAIVARFQTPEGAPAAPPIRYRVEDLSLTFGIDTTIAALPADTVILSVPPSTYRVTILDLPTTCAVRGQASQVEAIAPETNTSLFRFVVFCRAQLVIENLVDGVFKDRDYVYRIRDASGQERLGLIGPADTLLFDRLAPGAATVRLSHVSENCVVLTDGGPEQAVQIPATGGAVAAFRVLCSDPRQAPALDWVATSLRDGVSGVLYHARDPNRDLDRLYWDLTDCRRRSLLRRGGRIRAGLGTGRTVLADTVTAMVAFETGMADAELAAACVSLRLEDQFGNSSGVTEVPVNSPGRGRPPFPLTFNAVLVGTQAIRTTLAADDPDGDFAGVFATARLRDGILSPPDGQPDIGVFNTIGYLDTALPDVLLGNGRPTYLDYLAIVVYLFDRNGNLTRVEDNDLFR